MRRDPGGSAALLKPRASAALRQLTEAPERRVRSATLDRRTGGTARARPATWPHLVQSRPAAREGSALADAGSPDGRPRFAAEAPGSRGADAPTLAEPVRAVDDDANVAGVALRVDQTSASHGRDQRPV